MRSAYLTNQLLIAMPSLADPNFAQTVTLICEHTSKGALGIVLNRPLGMALGDVFKQLALESSDAQLTGQPVLRGGPVQQVSAASCCTRRPRSSPNRGTRR